ncbi:hypothetical protein D349_00852 [Enterococcus faecalis UP2S-6]|nr:hypothetical protein D349_00852 [Enterococcus faecalis UP2S-6]
MKKRMEQIEEILSCEENSAGVRLKELVEALELEVTNQNLLKVTSVLHMNPRLKKIMHTKTVMSLRCINFYKISR